MELSDFDFDLPPGRIADRPAAPRDRARLLVVDRESGRRTDATFSELASFLRRGDTLVVNDTKVIKARIRGTVERNGRPVEVFFANAIESGHWEALLQPGRRVRPGDRILVTVTGLEQTALRVGPPTSHGLREVAIESGSSSVPELLETAGHVPLPPYISREDEPGDRADYQTIYAEQEGAVAAPTAGLHFTPAVLESLAAHGIEVERITLHVGVGTFQPIRTDDITRHRMKAERFSVSEGAARRLNRARSEGRRIIAVGTTTTRTLEHIFTVNKEFAPGEGNTDLFIYPGYGFQAIDGLITNFHLPRSMSMARISAGPISYAVLPMAATRK